jgi:hypothetical protein
LVGVGVYFLTRDKNSDNGGKEDVKSEEVTVVQNTTERPETEEQNKTEEVTAEDTEEFTEEVTEEPTEEALASQEIAIEDYTAEKCVELIDELKKQEYSYEYGDVYYKLYHMTSALINAKIINENGQVLSDMSDEDKLIFDYRILADVAYNENSVFYSSIEMENGTYCNLADAEDLFYEVYGCKEVPASGFNGIAVDGETLTFYMATGDAWNNIYNASVQELGNYYLVTAPYFYGCNGNVSMELLGYADILFVKNEDSRFGVTILYAKTHKNNITIDSIEVSSQLEPQQGKDYGADNLFDDNYSTAWVEGKNGLGIGETITIYLKEPTMVYGVLIFNGYLASADLYNKNGKVTGVSVTYGEDSYTSHNFYLYDIDDYDGVMGYEDYNVGIAYAAKPIVTDKIVITIDDATAGSKYDDVCISELKIY